MSDGNFQLQVPSLINGIRGAGLLVGIHKVSDNTVQLTTVSLIEGSPVDAYGKDGVVVFVTHDLNDTGY